MLLLLQLDAACSILCRKLSNLSVFLLQLLLEDLVVIPQLQVLLCQALNFLSESCILNRLLIQLFHVLFGSILDTLIVLTYRRLQMLLLFRIEGLNILLCFMSRFTPQLHRLKLLAQPLVLFILLVQLSIAFILDYKLLFNTFLHFHLSSLTHLLKLFKLLEMLLKDLLFQHLFHISTHSSVGEYFQLLT